MVKHGSRQAEDDDVATFGRVGQKRGQASVAERGLTVLSAEHPGDPIDPGLLFEAGQGCGGGLHASDDRDRIFALRARRRRHRIGTGPIGERGKGQGLRKNLVE